MIALELAGHVFQFDTDSEYLARLGADYRVDKSGSLIQASRKEVLSDVETAKQEGFQLSYDYCESYVLHRNVCKLLLQDNTCVFHGSALAMDGVAYLFAAISGTGKSTHARLWREHFGERVVMVNDDKPFLHIGEKEVTVYGSPWSGKHDLDTNTSAPLKALVILTRDATNHIEPISFHEAFPILMQQVHRPEDKELVHKVTQLMVRLGHMVKLYKMGCNMDPEAAVVAYEGMNKGINK